VTDPRRGDVRTWTFLAPACPRPTGGDIARFELVNGIARQGRDLVRVVHVPTWEMHMRDLSDLPWFAFDPRVEQQFAPDLDPDAIPDSDVVVYSTKLLATALSPDYIATGRRLVAQLQADRDRRWLPILFLQGQGVWPAPVEELSLQLPGPKVCVGAWMAEHLVKRGVPPADVVHIPNGLDPQVFRLRRPIEGREPRVAMNFDPFPAKRGTVGVDAIDRLYRRLAVPATVFGTISIGRALAPGLDFVFSPTQQQLAEQIYSSASLFLQPSRQEGFGLCAVEAMACGCALVTTANGGSAEYAVDGETAIVCGSEAEEMAEAMSRLVTDDGLRARIAGNGSRYVERFRWPESAARLVAVATACLADAGRYRAAEAVDLDAVVVRLRA
jgi:glycosyltransferase involved in cell wall biosynthesis